MLLLYVKKKTVKGKLGRRRKKDVGCKFSFPHKASALI